MLSENGNITVAGVEDGIAKDISGVKDKDHNTEGDTTVDMEEDGITEGSFENDDTTVTGDEGGTAEVSSEMEDKDLDSKGILSKDKNREGSIKSNKTNDIPADEVEYAINKGIGEDGDTSIDGEEDDIIVANRETGDNTVDEDEAGDTTFDGEENSIAEGTCVTGVTADAGDKAGDTTVDEEDVANFKGSCTTVDKEEDNITE